MGQATPLQPEGMGDILGNKSSRLDDNLSMKFIGGEVKVVARRSAGGVGL